MGFHSEGVEGFIVRRCRGFHSEGVEGFIVRVEYVRSGGFQQTI